MGSVGGVGGVGRERGGDGEGGGAERGEGGWREWSCWGSNIERYSSLSLGGKEDMWVVNALDMETCGRWV